MLSIDIEENGYNNKIHHAKQIKMLDTRMSHAKNPTNKGKRRAVYSLNFKKSNFVQKYKRNIYVSCVHILKLE